MGKRNPGATRPRDGDEERLARARERGRDGVLGRARQLRLPTMAAQGGYTFDEGEVNSSSKPSQYPLLGFKDRKLEDDYLEYLVVASRARIILGYVTVILLYALGPFATS